jgi:periplasmic divalent cation tolerance protein
MTPASDEVLVVLCSVPDAETGARIGRALVEERLAACVNVLPAMRSIYTWQGAVSDEAEALCMVKTRRALYPALRARIEALHSYQVPEILALPVTDGNAAYLSWVLQGTREG